MRIVLPIAALVVTVLAGCASNQPATLATADGPTVLQGATTSRAPLEEAGPTFTRDVTVSFPGYKKASATVTVRVLDGIPVSYVNQKGDVRQLDSIGCRGARGGAIQWCVIYDAVEDEVIVTVIEGRQVWTGSA